MSEELTLQYGKGYDRSNLYHCLRFYKEFPEIVDTTCRQSHIRLTWSHYRCLLQVKDSKARAWYEKEAYEQTWSDRTLQRNINTQYYHRILQSQHKDLVEQEMQEKTSAFQNDKLEFIKNPVIAEFLGLSSNTDFTETDLETSIISNIQKFLMELGKGYAFAARQQHIKTEKEDYFIDIVFYNYILKCFILIDLKTDKNLPPNINYICRQKKSFAMKLKHRRPCFICSKRNGRVFGLKRRRYGGNPGKSGKRLSAEKQIIVGYRDRNTFL